ncbi:MAG: AzlC family ABC transporter permease [Hyphomicrobiales bacterium]|nr:AzlC family ABC transporter permease [Hyphomicrobiales bacterium]
MTNPSALRATATRAGVVQGMRDAIPFAPGTLIFGASVGAAAAHKGLPALVAIAQSALVYAGASQMVTLELWSNQWRWAALAAGAGATAAINARFLLMSAGFRRWIGGLNPALVYSTLFFLTDPSFAVGARRFAAGERDYGVTLGVAMVLYPAWVMATAAGFYGGALIARPERYGLDLIMPLVFVCMLTSFLRSTRRIAPYTAATLAALGAWLWLPGGWYIVAGALAGALTAAAAP